VLDAGSASNLLATQRSIELLDALQVTALITPGAKAQVLSFVGPVNGNGRQTRIPADFSPLVEAHALVEQPLDGSFVDELVRCAEELTGVDAESLALAAGLNLPIVSDDDKVRAVAGRLYPQVVLLSSLELIRRGVEKLGLSAEQITELLRSMQGRGNYLAPRSGPEFEWFSSHLR
jgi:hypothetical protein